MLIPQELQLSHYKFGIFLIVNMLNISVLFEYRCFKVDTLL